MNSDEFWHQCDPGDYRTVIYYRVSHDWSRAEVSGVVHKSNLPGSNLRVQFGPRSHEYYILPYKWVLAVV